MKNKINIQKTTLTGIFTLIFLRIMSINSFAEETQLQAAFKVFYNDYKWYLTVFIGFGICTSILSFIYNITRIGMYGDNPKKRSLAITNTIISGICTTLLGSLSVIIALFCWITMGK